MVKCQIYSHYVPLWFRPLKVNHKGDKGLHEGAQRLFVNLLNLYQLIKEQIGFFL